MNHVLPIAESTDVAQARRIAVRCCEQANLSDETCARAAIVATELATNLLKYAPGGELIVGGLSHAGPSHSTSPGIEIISLDRGPGIADIEQSLRDGYSTSGTLGNGLGAIRRQSDEFDVYSERAAGTIILARICDRPHDPSQDPFILGAICRPVPGETVSGDAWSVRSAGDQTLLIVADGLGHGLGAAQASQAAIEAFCISSFSEPSALLQDIHRAVRGTRGAAVAIAAVDWQNRKVLYAGVGNIASVIVEPARQQSLISHNGTVGHEVRRFQTFTYSFGEGAMLVMHSDGLSSHWNIAAHPGLIRRHPAVIAAALFRESLRSRDDACVLTIRRKEL